MTAVPPLDIQSGLDLATAIISTAPPTYQPTDKMPRTTKKQAAANPAPRPASPSDDPDSPSPIPDLQVPDDSQDTVVMEVGEIEEVELPDTQVAGPSQEGPPKRKRQRPSKKDIQTYDFTEEQQRAIAEFVQEHDCLYNKRNREWSNPTKKDELWRQCAAAFDNCSGLQVRKYFEARRTDFGKIEKKAYKSGAAARRLTAREEEVMTVWGFLGGHIAHEATQSSHTFSPPPSSRHGENDEGSGGDLSGLSAASLERRRQQRRRAGRQEGEQQLTSQLGDFMETLQSYIPRRSPSNLSATEASFEMGIQHAVTILKRIPEDFREEFVFTVLNAGRQLLGDVGVNREWKENLARGKVGIHRPPRPATHDSATQTSPSPSPTPTEPLRQWQQPPPAPPPTSNVVYVPQYVAPAQQQQHLIHRAVTYTAPAAASPQPHQAFSMGGSLTFSPPAPAPSPLPTSQPPPSFPTPSPASMVPMSPYPDVPPTPGRSLETPQPVPVPAPAPVRVHDERKDEEEDDSV